MESSELLQLYQAADHWRHHHCGDLWLRAAQALAANQPSDARRACQWSCYYFDLYAAAWTAHAPASRWDSDGGAEIMDVQKVENSLAAGQPDSPSPDWTPLLLAGDWQGALTALGDAAVPEEFKPLAAVLADACKMAGQEGAANQLVERIA